MYDPVIHARAPEGALRLSTQGIRPGQGCMCCGRIDARVAVAHVVVCLTCAPAYALDEPDIETVAALIWLPQMDQGVLGRLVSAIHLARKHPEITDVAGMGVTADHASRTFGELHALRAEARKRFGTDSPATLRRVVSRTPSPDLDARNGMSGLRILMRGTWFGTDPDFYLRTLHDQATGS